MTLTPPTPTRRTLLRTAAWTTPVVVVSTAAPAFAGSNPAMMDCLVRHTINWSALNDTTSEPLYVPPVVAGPGATVAEWPNIQAELDYLDGTLAGTSSPLPATLTILTEMLTGTLRHKDTADNKHFTYTELGQKVGAPDDVLNVGKALKLGTDMNTGGSSDMRITLSFSRPIQGLRFTLTDIDANPDGSQRDQVWIETLGGDDATGSSFSSIRATGSTPTFTGHGIESDPWVGGSANAVDSSVLGNVRIICDGPEEGFTSMTIRFGNISTSPGQRSNTINLGNIVFETNDNICAA